MATMQFLVPSVDRYVASMVLSGVGDAFGYKNGSWEFCHSGSSIFKECEELGGVENITIKLPNWMVSDDTVMHLATGEAMIEAGADTDKEKLYSIMAQKYVESMGDMTGRAPGNTCMFWTAKLKPNLKKGYQISFNPRGAGCGAAMRAMCIGLRYPRPEQLDDLIALSVESGRMTHHHPIGYLGSFAAALFTAYAVQGKPAKRWGKDLMDTLPRVKEYVLKSNHCSQENEEQWGYFDKAWEKYLASRSLTDGDSDPVFPDAYGFEERDAFTKSVSLNGWGGATGHDAPMIAYDAFLGAGNNWKELCYRGMFHAGDSDSTGVMAAAWYGVVYGFEGVPKCNYKDLEYKSRLGKVGKQLYALAFPGEAADGCELL